MLMIITIISCSYIMILKIPMVRLLWDSLSWFHDNIIIIILPNPSLNIIRAGHGCTIRMAFESWVLGNYIYLLEQANILISKNQVLEMLHHVYSLFNYIVWLVIFVGLNFRGLGSSDNFVGLYFRGVPILIT